MPEPFKEWARRDAVETLPLHHVRDDLWALVTPYGLRALTLEASADGLVGFVVLPGDRRWSFAARRVAEDG